MGNPIHSLTIFLGVALAASVLWGDSVLLKDGSRVEGDLKHNADGSGWTLTTADGKTRNISADSVKSVELGSAPVANAQQAAEGLSSLRRSVEVVSDINQIIERYQRFIGMTKDASTLAEANADLKQWQERKQQGLVKYGNKWVSADDVAAIQLQAYQLSEQAREMVRQNRTRDAEQFLQQALTIDPRNPSANYLRGVILFRQDKIADARKFFEAANAAAHSHPPTLNNLAVVLWRQKQQAAALNFYDQALQAAGVNEYILNNLAEALGTMPEEMKKGAPAAKALRRFSELDQVLQQTKSQQGQFRWGGGWVDQKQLDDLKAAEKKVKDKLEAMQTEFDQSKVRIGEIDREVANNEEQMNELRLRSFFRDSTGAVVTYPLPQIYYELQRRNTSLRTEQDSLRTRMATMQDQVQEIQKQVPVPKFTGVQQIVGVEGMPVPDQLLPARSTTKPAL